MPRKKKSASEQSAASDEGATEVIPIEAALEELSEIVATLEGGGETLDDALRLFERGMTLMRVCHQRLDAAAQRIELVTKLDEDGTVETTGFDGTPTRSRKTTQQPSHSSESSGRPRGDLFD